MWMSLMTSGVKIGLRPDCVVAARSGSRVFSSAIAIASLSQRTSLRSLGSRLS